MELIFLFLCFSLTTGNERTLPSWIRENPGFKNPQRINSVGFGNGSIGVRGKGTEGWLINLNDKSGHGIEMDVDVEDFSPDLGDFVLVSAWPLTGKDTQMKLITGKKVSRKFRLPNTKDFFVLYQTTSNNSGRLHVKYNRYGSSLEINEPSTENPIKKKETIYEIHLKGKSPESYKDPGFIGDFKKALRAIARRYCSLHGIPFNETIPTEEMVRVLRVSFCPFEWPERNVCAFLEHSVFVSGIRLPRDEIILDYQLTADHLKKMWAEDSLEELKALGLDVFSLPSPTNVVVYWTVILGLVILSSLLGTFVFWKTSQFHDFSLRKDSGGIEETKKTPARPKLKLGKLDKIPSFMFDSENSKDSAIEKFASSTVEQEGSQDFLKPKSPMRNYLGSILFNSNRAFEDDDEYENEDESKESERERKRNGK